MKTCAQITASAFWAPALQSEEAWLNWAFDQSAELSSDNEERAAAKNVPSLLRRRLSPLGRAVAEVTGRFEQALKDDNTALVFASRWGDVDNAVRELHELIDTGNVSPTLFATSVHNGIAAILSIAHQHHGFETAVAAGPFSLEAGFSSAVGLLTEHPRVLLISYDSIAPEEFQEKNTFTHAIAFLLEAQKEPDDRDDFLQAWDRGPFLALTTRTASSFPDPRLDTLTGMADLDVVRWLIADDSPFLCRHDRHTDWIWAKNTRLQLPFIK